MVRRMRAWTIPLLIVLAACNGGGSSSATDAGSTGSGGSSGGGGESSGGGPGTTADDPTSTGGGSQSGTTSTTTGEPGTTVEPGTVTGEPGTTVEPGTTTGEPGSTGTTGEPADPVYDPAEDGPWTYDQIEGELTVGAAKVPVVAYYPTGGPEPGPYPVVTIAHGFNLPPTQYTKYAERLASHGYVAINVDHRAYIGQTTDHVANAKQVLAAIDWAATEATLKTVADTDNVGTTGHSLGGKISVLGAVMDPRVKASITVDPVDGATMCPNMQVCPDVSAMLPIAIPLGYLGEVTDAEGFMSCAPKADNYQSFYVASDPPALAVTVNGANHMSFIDDVASCGIVCAFCKAATLDNATVNDLSRAYVVAFYGRWLRNNPGYDTYLTGAEAQARYVDKGYVTLAEK